MHDLQERLEADVGLRIFTFPMPASLAGLFAYNDLLGGCIGLNAHHPRERRNWSLAHEFGHFLTSRYQPEATPLRSRKSTSHRERLADSFAKRTLYLPNPDDADEPREPVDLSPFLERNLLEETTIQSKEEETIFVGLATQLEDGEAMTMAIALCRNLAFATDERKARRLFLTSGGSEEALFSTSSILKTWSEQQSLEIAPHLKLIETRARFRPGKTDPLRQWWIGKTR